MRQAKPTPEYRRAADLERRKRLGQYFTGLGLGRLLAALAQADEAKTIIDPMVGSGDLLAACLGVSAKPEILAGIEIDTAAFDTCQERLPEAACLQGSAFDPELLSRLPAKSWDLVIANPPYVRYQSFSDKANSAHALPSAMQIRTGLLQAIQHFPALDAEDKRLFAHLISGYSGLSDLAVPSWILCAAMVKTGGRLALVVPESWLSRDYATIVHYLLFRWFDIEFVVEDEHASWFDDAQVKTSLIVAKRVKRRASAFSRPKGAIYCHVTISAAAATPESPIGRFTFPDADLERSFARQARSWLTNAAAHSNGLARARPVSVQLACANVIASASRQKWFASLGEQESTDSESVYIPHEIHDWLATRRLAPDFATFAAHGIDVGQGLRTGANRFFYADGKHEGELVHLSFAGPLAGHSAMAPVGVARPVLRKQAELPDGFVVKSANTKGWAVDLRRHALPEDAERGDLLSAAHAPIPQELAEVVRAAARANFGTEVKPAKVWELTAVAPNIRAASRGAPSRHWYMLPDFAPRHLPDVFLARVNAATPRAYLNEARASLIDANFSTMWTLPSSKWTAHALLAFMNSGWAQAVIERSGAVMGGGALKVEATHLRRFPVPAFTPKALARMRDLGLELVSARDVEEAAETLEKIDAIVLEALGCGGGASELRAIAKAGEAQRAKHNGRRGEDHGDNDLRRKSGQDVPERGGHPDGAGQSGGCAAARTLGEAAADVSGATLVDQVARHRHREPGEVPP